MEPPVLLERQGLGLPELPLLLGLPELVPQERPERLRLGLELPESVLQGRLERPEPLPLPGQPLVLRLQAWHLEMPREASWQPVERWLMNRS